jgi:pyruvate kinase
MFKTEYYIDDQHSFNPITEFTVRSAGQLAESLDAKILAVVSRSGLTTLSLSKNRFFVPTVGIACDEKILRRMCLYWGVIPLLATSDSEDTEAISNLIIDWGKNCGYLSSGDRLVIVGGTGISKSAHNQIIVHDLD